MRFLVQITCLCLCGGILTAGTDGVRQFLLQATFSSIDFPGASRTTAWRINPGGDIVGQYASAGVVHGYVLSGGWFTSIDFPGANSTVANGINPRGDIVGWYLDEFGAQHGFLLSGAGVRFRAGDKARTADPAAAAGTDHR